MFFLSMEKRTFVECKRLVNADMGNCSGTLRPCVQLLGTLKEIETACSQYYCVFGSADFSGN